MRRYAIALAAALALSVAAVVVAAIVCLAPSRANIVRQFNDEYLMSSNFHKELNCRNAKEADWLRLGMDKSSPDAFNNIQANRIEWESRFNRQADRVTRLATALDRIADR